ncbi:MAG TPA: ATP-binding protein [Nannocystis sp.]
MNQRAELDERTIVAVLGKYVSPARAQTIVTRARREPVTPFGRSGADTAGLMLRIAEGLRIFLGETDTRAAIADLQRHASGKKAEPVELDLRVESDIARARSAARTICEALGASPLLLQKLVTIVSELARNSVIYAGGGKLTLRPDPSTRRVYIEAKDQGPGIPNLEEILAGRYKSRSGLGLGILGTRRLADGFSIQSSSAGTHVKVEVAY